MTDALLALVASYGAIVLFFATFLSCLALPVPASLMMLAGGGFAASGDIALVNAVAAAYIGAISGDQTGFAIGRQSGRTMEKWLDASPKRAALHRRARRLTDHYGGLGVFFSRWLVSPLGPYVNLAGGATGLNWTKFLVWGALGEAVWVTAYVGLGYAFADEISQLSDVLGNASGFLAALAITIGLGLWLRGTIRKSDRNAA